MVYQGIVFPFQRTQETLSLSIEKPVSKKVGEEIMVFGVAHPFPLSYFADSVFAKREFGFTVIR